MKFALPAPSPDIEMYNKVFDRGLKRFPKRKENFENYKNSDRRSTYVDYLPVKMDYELVSRCNFRCKMCLMSTIENGKRAEDTSFEDFKQSLDEMYGLVEIKLQGIGEPLLNPRIFDMIALASERDIWTRITCNGSLLHVNDNYKKLIDANPGEVQISIDGSTKDVYEGIRIGSDFNKVINNATLLNQYANSKNLLKTRCWTLVQKSNVHQLEDIVLLARKLEFKRITFSMYLSPLGNKDLKVINTEQDASYMLDSKRAASLVELGRNIGIEVTFWNAGERFKVTEDRKNLCSWIFERSFISSDMKIVPCCTLSNPETLNLGDAREFTKNWNSKAYQDLRASHISGNIPDVCKDCYLGGIS